jgi:TRAP-type C4-dicarboxylate transport system permease small subunit
MLAGIISAAALALLCFDVVTRYFFPSYLPDWSSEVIVYLVVWAMFLVAGELAIEGKHVHADLLVDHLPTKGKWGVGIVASLAGLGFSILFLRYGWEVVAFARMIGEEGESSLRFPKYLYYLALPVGMTLQCLGYLVRLWDQIQGGSETSTPPESVE